MISPIEISLMAGVALLLFGAERLPKIARSAGEMRREFMRGQTEAEAPPTMPETTPTAVPSVRGDVPAGVMTTTVEPKDREPHSA